MPGYNNLSYVLTGMMVDYLDNYDIPFAVIGTAQVFGGLIVIVIFIRQRYGCAKPPVQMRETKTVGQGEEVELMVSTMWYQ